jgi:hypothetical protein
MQIDILIPKIELLQEQIDNLERSGYFTEAEMDRATISLKIELLIYKQCEALHTFSSNLNNITDSILNFTESVAPNYESASDQLYEQAMRNANAHNWSELAKDYYGMTKDEFIKGIEVHNQSFDQLKTINPNNITVVDAEILTPSIQQL